MVEGICRLCLRSATSDHLACQNCFWPLFHLRTPAQHRVSVPPVLLDEEVVASEELAAEEAASTQNARQSQTGGTVPTLLGLLVVIVGCLVGVAIVGQTVWPGGTSGTDDSSSSRSPAASSSPNLPASYDFMSPSTNILCRVTEIELICQQVDIHYPKPEAACVSDLPGVAIGLTQDGTQWPCLEANLTKSTVLQYDESLEKFGFRCLINLEAGITCSNRQGDTFNMERDRGAGFVN